MIGLYPGSLLKLRLQQVSILWKSCTAQKMKLSFKDFVSKCDQIRSFLWIWSRLLKKSLMENFIFCVVRIELIAKYLNISFFLCGKYRNFARNYAELHLSTKFPYQEIRWNYSIFRSFLFSHIIISDSGEWAKAISESCSEKSHKIIWKTLVTEYFLSKVADLQPETF